jgi:hypothetical protein
MASLFGPSFSATERNTIQRAVESFIKPDDIVFLQNWKNDVEHYLEFFNRNRAQNPNMSIDDMIERFYNFTTDVFLYIKKNALVNEEDIEDCSNRSEIKLGNAIVFNTRCRNIDTLYKRANDTLERMIYNGEPDIESTNQDKYNRGKYWTQGRYVRGEFEEYEELFLEKLDEEPDHNPDEETEEWWDAYEENPNMKDVLWFSVKDFLTPADVRFLLWLTLIPETKAAQLMNSETQEPTPEPATNASGAAEEEVDPRTCYDAIMLSDEGIKKYLDQNENNFVIKLPNSSNNYECMSMDYLKRQWGVDATKRPDLNQPYYKKWYECRKKNNKVSLDNVITNLSYIRIGSYKFLIEKPWWIYDGVPPEPRIFELFPGKEVITVASSENLEGEEEYMNDNTGDYCNTEPETSYKLGNVVEPPSGVAFHGGRVRKTKKKKSKTNKSKKSKKSKQSKKSNKKTGNNNKHQAKRKTLKAKAKKRM